MRTLILGLGNPMLGDDSFGWRVVEHLQSENHLSQLVKTAAVKSTAEVEMDCLAVGGLALMERMVGYERVILVDALSSGQAPTGTVTTFPVEALPDPQQGHTSSAHDVSLRTALELGRRLGAPLPAQILIVAVETPHVYEFSESLSPPVAAAVPIAAGIIMEYCQ
jgi:hydrogenase maturation protease